MEMPIGARELNHHASYYSKQARCVRVCNRMTTAEAPAAQVKEKDLKRYFRVDGKANMTAPAEAATWFKLISVRRQADFVATRRKTRQGKGRNRL
jgi:hypothetical protein